MKNTETAMSATTIATLEAIPASATQIAAIVRLATRISLRANSALPVRR
jgi:hypothetical protein